MNLKKAMLDDRYQTHHISDMCGVSKAQVLNWINRTSTPKLVHLLILKSYFGRKLEIESLLTNKDLKKLGELKKC